MTNQTSSHLPALVIEGEIVETGITSALQAAGQTANEYAARGAFADYLSRKADNTVRRQAGDLARFAEYLQAAGIQAGDLQHNPESWRGITWGMVEGFRSWMVTEGDAVGSINVRLSTVKTYAKLATKAGAVDPQENAMIRLVSGYTHKEANHIDERRETTRRGDKKAAHVTILENQAKQLKRQPDTAQGRRDALIMALLLDHGLRVGEMVGLKVNNFNLKTGELKFYRPKVDKVQIHKLSADTLRASRAWFDSGDAPMMQDQPVLRASRKNGKLTDAGMSERAITDRVKVLGEHIGLEGLSAHDCRHFWATFWAKKVDVLRLQEAGGWNSLAMPRRYVEDAEIANEGMA
jgi:integrase